MKIKKLSFIVPLLFFMEEKMIFWMIIMMGLFFPAYAKIYVLNTRNSSILTLRNNFLCNYDDQEKSVYCYKASLTNPSLFEKHVIVRPGKTYEICGLKTGTGFVGSFYRSPRHDKESLAGTCSVWIADEKPE